jgi:Zn finger protein HypA/HybF involved in hydrogenase expression
MKESHITSEPRSCVCRHCDEAFIVEGDAREIRCPHCGNDDQETLVFESEEEDQQPSA